MAETSVPDWLTEAYRCENCEKCPNLEEVAHHMDKECLVYNAVLDTDMNSNEDFDAVLTDSTLNGLGVKIHVPCQHCGLEIEYNVSADATPVYEDDDPDSDKMPSIDYYDIDDFKIVHPDEDLPQRIFDAAFGPPDEYDYEKDEVYFDIDEETVGEPSELELDIIARTAMNQGYCYMGIDSQDRLFRPIFNTGQGQCCWPYQKFFEVGDRVKFRVLRHPNTNLDQQENNLTNYPHATEDTVVSQDTKVIGKFDKSKLYSRLYNKAKPDVDQIFGPLFDRKYVNEDKRCCSAGLLRCKEKDLQYEIGYNGKRRLVIDIPNKPSYNFPFTSLDEGDRRISNSNRNVVVLLGLGRGFDAGGRFNRKRCYVLTLNFFKE